MPRPLSAAFPSCPLLLGVLVLLLPGSARAQTTDWVGTLGDWSEASNWSSGVPTAGTDARVPFAATPTVTVAGATCRNLSTGTGSGGSTLRIQGGSLNVVEVLHIATAFGVSAQQTGGTVGAGEIRLGNPKTTGTWTMTGGTLTAGTVRVGAADPTSSGLMSMSATNPSCTIGDSLVIGPDGSFVCGAGTLVVGSGTSGGTRVDGAFTLNNSPSATMAGFTMGADGTLSIAITLLGISKINVTGAAVLNGTLLVTDVLAENGTYEVLTAGSIAGGFTAATLPPDWSWRIEGNRLLLTKGTVPVDRTTWGRIKAGLDR